jgi:hypothetical protein
MDRRYELNTGVKKIESINKGEDRAKLGSWLTLLLNLPS